ncbi:hypothetical protein B0H19DRAFT_937834 [Mycena capillaripes]|nr:hypothetical protein B0H19DRAFT_951855 [Mycena capillaripes]KAJ6568566.1 hypothetical protein B0H19DRAFT_937834 [Mycena capillaripes]
MPQTGPNVVHSTADVRKEIISIVNATWDTGIPLGMNNLPSIIAPNSTVYRTDCALATIRHAKATPVLFVWMKISEIMPMHAPKSARYAVAFFLPSEAPFHIVDLAWMLLRFQDFHIRECDYHRFNLISLAYHIHGGGTYGLLLYDKHLRHAYQKALHLARSTPSRFKSSEFGHPISTWPPNSDSAATRTTQNIKDLMTNIR